MKPADDRQIWTRSVAISVAVVAALVAGGCARNSAAVLHTGPAFGAPARSFASSQLQGVAVATNSSCATTDDCRKMCKAGSPAACTNLGDRLFARQSHAAQAAWLRGCRGRHALSCARLMQVTAHDPKLANEYGARGCRYGDMAACEYVGIAQLTAALAPTNNESKPQLLTTALEHLERACRANRWLGCAWAPIALHRIGSVGAPGKMASMGRRAYALAVQACERHDGSACFYAMTRHRRAGERSLETQFWHKTCLVDYRNATPANRESTGTSSRACKWANRLKVPLTAAERDSATAAGQHGSTPHRWHKRISGRHYITPSERVKRRLSLTARGRRARIDAILEYCISPIGTVDRLYVRQGSGSPSYDRRLFDNLRTWRYQPHSHEGKAVRACGTMHFIYRLGGR